MLSKAKFHAAMARSISTPEFTSKCHANLSAPETSADHRRASVLSGAGERAHTIDIMDIANLQSPLSPLGRMSASPKTPKTPNNPDDALGLRSVFESFATDGLVPVEQLPAILVWVDGDRHTTEKDIVEVSLTRTPPALEPPQWTPGQSPCSGATTAQATEAQPARCWEQGMRRPPPAQEGKAVVSALGQGKGGRRRASLE